MRIAGSRQTIATAREGTDLATSITERDLLWAMRMCVGEEGPRADYEAYRAIVSSMVRRLVTIGHRLGRATPPWRDLTDLIVGDPDRGLQGYSDPISWQQRHRGDADEIARRAQIRSLEEKDIPPAARNAVRDILYGRRPLNVPTSVHFAAARIVRSRLAQPDRYPGWKRVQGPSANWHVSVTSSRNAREVVVTGPCLLRKVFAGE